jgi:hypothetical protein
MKDQLKPSLCFEGGINCFTKVLNGKREDVSHDEEASLVQ